MKGLGGPASSCGPNTTHVAHVIAHGLDARSALGPHSSLVSRTLIDAGWRVWLDVETARGVPSALRPLLAEPPVRSDLALLQYPIWYPRAEQFRNVTGAALFWYHGVTPPSVWPQDGHDMLSRSIAGTQLAWYAHLAITDSAFGAEELVQHSGYPSERVRIIPPAVDVGRFALPPTARVLEKLKKRWRLQGKRVLLYVGRLAPNKRVDLLVEALALLSSHFPDLHLLIVGDDSSLPAYRDIALALKLQADSLGLADKLSITGPVEDTQPYYHLATLFTTASVHEGFGLPLIEAMAAGVPVIASASGAMPWLLEAGTNMQAGLLFEPGSSSALAEAIDRGLTQESKRLELISRARLRADVFTPKRFAASLLETVAEAKALAALGAPPGVLRPKHPLYRRADVALRDFRVRSKIPIMGPLIAWLRRQSTSHIKEAYLDRVIEQQVMFNRDLVDELERLHDEIEHLKGQLADPATGHPRGDRE